MTDTPGSKPAPKRTVKLPDAPQASIDWTFYSHIAERTSDDVCTVAPIEHLNIPSGVRVDVVWGGGCRRGVDAVSNEDKTLSICGGDGVPFPSENTPVNIKIKQADG